MKIAAIIITFNRLELLKQCIDAVKNQALKTDEIIVINNQSTDGTADWLAKQEGITVITQPNTGGSGGVYTAIKYAYPKGYDWFWIMDDDTIPNPDSLYALYQNIVDAKKLGVENIGFIGSKVIWKDGAPHLMNIPHLANIDPQGMPFNQLDQVALYGISASSFVSLMLSREAVQKVGLPLKEFYIWGDDTEYTRRITRSGFSGYYSSSSVVLHNTSVNYSANIFTDTPNNIWKYNYGIRNELFLVKHFGNSFKFYSKFFKRMLVFPFRIFKRRKDYRWAFIKTNWRASLSALNFNPQIDQV